MPKSRFLELLSEIESEHDNDIEYLTAQIEQLRAEVRRLNAAAVQALASAADAGRAKANDQELADPKRSSSRASSHSELPLKNSAEEDEFELKGVWKNMPEDSRLWGRDIDQDKVTLHMRNLSKGATEKWEAESEASSHPIRASVSELVNSRAFKCIGVVSPSNSYRMAWDLTGMCLISYDMITIPIDLSFQPKQNEFTSVMGWLTLIFWSCDMVTSLFTGYYHEGKLILTHSKVIMNYLKGWLWIDLAVVVPDWVMKLMGSTVRVAGLGRILRALRAMRILRLLRIMKLKKVMNMVYNLIDSEYMFIVFNLGKLLMLILILNHMVACAWFFVGRVSKDAGSPKNWLQDIGETPVYDEDLEWQYLTSLHWSITQFTPASMDIFATNIPERIFSIAILFWALVALSSIIGSVSASMTALRNMSSDEMKQFWLLRRYLKQKNIKRELGDRIEKFLEYRWVEQSHAVDPSKVKLLDNLSVQLQLELASAMSAPLLKYHRFFKRLDKEVPAIMFKVCSMCLKPESYAQNDLVFQPGEECFSMYFVKTGTFEYQVDGKKQETPLSARAWASEAILWTTWVHRGLLTALEPSDMVSVQPKEFGDVLRMHMKTWELAHRYGTQFVAMMNHYNQTSLTDVLWQFDPPDWHWIFEEEEPGGLELLESLGAEGPVTETAV